MQCLEEAITSGGPRLAWCEKLSCPKVRKLEKAVTLSGVFSGVTCCESWAHTALEFVHLLCGVFFEIDSYSLLEFLIMGESSHSRSVQ